MTKKEWKRGYSGFNRCTLIYCSNKTDFNPDLFTT
jgi:hypothetical protein